MSEVYRLVQKPKKVRPGDYLRAGSSLDRITQVIIYPPVARSQEDRPVLCPIRDDWWAIVVHTDEGGVEWVGEPDMPGNP